jgi:hypothetical protein
VVNRSESSTIPLEKNRQSNSEKGFPFQPSLGLNRSFTKEVRRASKTRSHSLGKTGWARRRVFTSAFGGRRFGGMLKRGIEDYLTYVTLKQEARILPQDEGCSRCRMRKETSPEIAKALRKSIWKASTRRVWEFFCPNCKQARRLAIPRKPLSIWAMSQLVGATAFITLATWSFSSWKGIVVIVPLAAAYELAYRLRVRGMMNCPHCGFDPYLYAVNVQSARREIEAFWRRKFDEKGIPFPGETQSPVQSETAPD